MTEPCGTPVFISLEYDNEVSTQYVVETYWARKKMCLFPVTRPTLILGVDPSFFSRSAEANSFYQ